MNITYQIVFPADIRECGRRNLEVDQGAEAEPSHGNGKTFGSKMIWIDLAEEHNARDVHTAAVDVDEHVTKSAINNLHIR